LVLLRFGAASCFFGLDRESGSLLPHSDRRAFRTLYSLKLFGGFFLDGKFAAKAS
jgi:hypothetical protein